MNFIEQLNWRYATKRMVADKAVPQEKVNTIVEAFRLSASSYGLQPYNLLIIEDKELLKQIQPLAFNQPQIVETSTLLVLAVWDKATQERIDAFFNLIASERGIPVEALAGYKAMVEGRVNGADEASVFNWMARQAYIALGTGLAAAAIEEVDATPMEGFNPDALDELLGLSAKGLKSVVIVPLGYRDEANDPLANAKKVRKSTEDFVVSL
ncbi:nitroreductase [Arcicella aurantiaca]|uniref:Nitroreductase n=1 Tax=Arcicella aurantiaca TaxID=591202 RepID=A0A316EFQ8_9BACT|nr:NAD(P)H-dependent oxidoreductase [Arcicella aurantiaca]PWK28533.1 nitroreductase [Arcicella aurantiaca]